MEKISNSVMEVFSFCFLFYFVVFVGEEGTSTYIHGSP